MGTPGFSSMGRKSMYDICFSIGVDLTPGVAGESQSRRIWVWNSNSPALSFSCVGQENLSWGRDTSDTLHRRMYNSTYYWRRNTSSVSPAWARIIWVEGRDISDTVTWVYILAVLRRCWLRNKETKHTSWGSSDLIAVQYKSSLVVRHFNKYLAWVVVVVLPRFDAWRLIGLNIKFHVWEVFLLQ